MKKYRKNRNLTLFMMVVVLIGYILKNTLLMAGDHKLYSGIVLLILISGSFIGLALPLMSRHAFKEFDGWMLGVFLLLIILMVLVVVQMIFEVYPAVFYGYAFDALAFIALCLALWENHVDFVKTNRARERSGSASAVLWAGASIVAVQGLMFKYRIKKHKK